MTNSVKLIKKNIVCCCVACFTVDFYKYQLSKNLLCTFGIVICAASLPSYQDF